MACIMVSGGKESSCATAAGFPRKGTEVKASTTLRVINDVSGQSARRPASRGPRPFRLVEDLVPQVGPQDGGEVLAGDPGDYVPQCLGADEQVTASVHYQQREGQPTQSVPNLLHLAGRLQEASWRGPQVHQWVALVGRHD